MLKCFIGGTFSIGLETITVGYGGTASGTNFQGYSGTCSIGLETITVGYGVQWNEFPGVQWNRPNISLFSEADFRFYRFR